MRGAPNSVPTLKLRRRGQYGIRKASSLQQKCRDLDEYALIAAGISVATVTVVTNMGVAEHGLHSSVATALK